MLTLVTSISVVGEICIDGEHAAKADGADRQRDQTAAVSERTELAQRVGPAGRGRAARTARTARP